MSDELSRVSVAIRGTTLKNLREIPSLVDNLELWFGLVPELPRRFSKFLRLRRLNIFSLRGLCTIAVPLPRALEQVGLFNLGELTAVTSHLSTVKTLAFVRCPQLQELSGQLESLEQFEVNDCPQLQFPELPATLWRLVHTGSNRQTLPYRLPVGLRDLELTRWPNLRDIPPLPESLRLLDLRGSVNVRRIRFGGKLVKLNRRPDGPEQITVGRRLKVFLRLRPGDPTKL